MALVYLENVLVADAPTDSVLALVRHVSRACGAAPEQLYVTARGRLVCEDEALRGAGVVRVRARLVGGKGGFGSMLRAIGAQIEKTTNREACRDLSGRRLRDINEEQRLRRWVEGRADRERAAAERRRSKLERLTAEPSTSGGDIKDAGYERERSELPERVGAAVEAGWAAGGAGGKRAAAGGSGGVRKRKKLWLDDELSGCSSSDEEGAGKEQVQEGGAGQRVEPVTSDASSEGGEVGTEAAGTAGQVGAAM